MREIKFRAWHEKLNRMIYNVSVQNSISEWHDETGKCWCIEDCIEQFTGVKDKNGHDIYEGDKLKDHGIVVWNNEEHRWSCIDLKWNDKREVHDLDYLTSEFKVIGNIHEDKIES
jgi:hypothetical protein